MRYILHCVFDVISCKIVKQIEVFLLQIRKTRKAKTNTAMKVCLKLGLPRFT